MYLNINNKNNDPNYRYKMPSLEIKQAGRGNGSYTILENISNVSETINYPTLLVLKYFSLMLGSSCNEDKLTLTGHYTKEELLKILYQFIENFVLCPQCSIPEIIPSVEGKKKNKNLNVTCSACGSVCILNHSNKINQKMVDVIIKYVEKNEWKVTKGNIVESTKNLELKDDLFSI